LDDAVQSFTTVLQNAARNSSQMLSYTPKATKDLPPYITQISEKQSQKNAGLAVDGKECTCLVTK